MNNPIVSQLLLIAGPLAILYFVFLRPQQMQKRKHEESIMAIKKGDEIVTAGGIVGDVIHIKALGTDGASTLDDRVTIRSGESKLIVERGRIARVIPAGAAQAAATKASVSSSAS
jgi:preprotein translocase subunit YajC